MNRNRINELISVYRDGLLEDVLPFWTAHGVDSQHGGFLTALDREGRVIDTDKAVWQQGRFTWLLTELYHRVEARDEWLRLAQHGADFLDAHCFDPADGRMWFLLTRDGRPLRKRRYAFSESFAAVAYAGLARITGRPEDAEKARRAFRRFVDHSENPQNVEPKFTDVRPTRSLAVPMITIVTAQQLRAAIGLEDAEHWIDRSIESIRRHHIKPDLQCVMETVGSDGEVLDHFDGRTLNPGHAIEGAWFILNEGKLRGDQELIRVGCQMLDWMWQRGWDARHGGILYFTDLKGLPVQEYWHDMKFWWPQNETIIACLLAYQLTGDPKYAEWHTQIHDWTHAHFPDAQHGEWFGYLHRDGTLSSTAKGNYWKGPFHIPRMQLECWKTLEAL
ncbi:AGE family epimerase/isomerase [Roseimaritima sediminicola]|uniref:AGE family epimerase/isomerase n=1 Tax=Roseimaritima sediminicola TaxID=2662066 RepID=UPI00129837D3|nr:AGE family epimerase/isomerase [Roseimaritima sediminicola]